MDPQAVEWLKTSIKRFNEWKTQQSQPADLEGASLCGLSLAGADFSHANLKEADVSGADLSGCNLDGTILYRANASDALLARCRMTETYAAEARFERANLSQVRASAANFSRATLTGACLDHARLLDVRFDGADLSGATLIGALLVRTPVPPGLQMQDAVVEKGGRTPPLPSVDFQWIGEDAQTFAIGQWTPRLQMSDEEVPSFVRNLRKFNRGDSEVINGFAKLVAGLVKTHHRLHACDAVACVPPSKTDATEYPTRELCREIARVGSLKDGCGFLVRHKTVLPSALLSLVSDENKHLDSVRVASPDAVSGRVILLCDDFIDSGSSFRACRHLLLAAGAKKVFCLALARRLPP